MVFLKFLEIRFLCDIIAEKLSIGFIMKLNLNLPKANGLFITGTDTGVGKTLISGGIAKVMSDEGVKVGCFKPISTGCDIAADGSLISTDARFLQKYSNVELDLDIINPIRYKVPAAPIVSAQVENKPINFNDIIDPYYEIVEKSKFVIVEGIGGVRVPLDRDVDVLDLMKEFDLPVILVTRPDLGTLNHTLLTIDAVRGANLELAGVIISGYNPKTKDIAEKTVEQTIIACGDIDVMAVVPHYPNASTENCEIANSHFALEDIPFQGMGSVV